MKDVMKFNEQENELMQTVENERVVDAKQVVNPFPNVRMIVKDGNQLWCLKDFAITIGYTGSNPVGSVEKLLTELEASTCSDVEQVQKEGTRFVKRLMVYAPIEILNSIVNRTALKTPSVTEWRNKMQQVGGEAVKSQLGMENGIDKMVNERVEKAVALQSNNSTEMFKMMLTQMQESSRLMITQMQEDSKRRDEDNKRFYAELFSKMNSLAEKLETVNPYQKSISEVSSYIPGHNATTLNKLLVAYGYLYRKNGMVFPTDKMKALNICKDSGTKYHTLCYKDEAIEFIKKIVKQYKIDNELF